MAGIARGGRAASSSAIVAAVRLGAMATALAALPACEPGGNVSEDEASARLQVMSPGEASATSGSDRLRIRLEALGESGAAADGALTQSERELLAHQVSACWNPPVGDIEPPARVVGLKLWMNQSGSVQRLEVLDQGMMADSPSLRASAESAIKAVMRCMPLKLPPDKYDRWKIFVMYFDTGPSVQR